MRRLALVLCATLVLAVALPSHVAAATITRTWTVGNEPFSATVDPRDGKVYVTISDSQNSSSPENMYVVDPSGSLPPDVIQLPAPQVTSVLDTGLDRLFVTLANGSLAIVDVASRTVVSTVANAGMLGAALDPATHYVYAAMAYGGVAMTDGATGTVLHRTTASSDAYWSVALDATRHRLYATNLNGPSLVVFDARDLTEISRVALPEIPRLALAVDEARGVVYVSGFNTETGFPGSHLYAVDETSLAITQTIDVGLGTMAAFAVTLDPAAGVLYASDVAENGTGELVGIDTVTFSVIGRMPLPWQPGQSAIGADGRLYVPGFNARLLAQIAPTPTLPPPDQAPVIDSWTMSTLTPRTNDVVTTTVAAHDPDGDPITIGYQWWVNTTGVAGQQQSIPGATSATLDLSQPGHGDLDDLLCLSIDVSDGQLHTTNMWCFAFVVDTAPLVNVAVAPTTPTTNATLHATATGSDADLTPLTYTYVWTVNGATRRTTVTSATTDDLDLSLAGNGDKGDAVSVSVIASDGRLSSAPAVAIAIVANSAPVVVVTLDNTTPGKRDVVTATAAATDADGDALTYAFTWRLNGAVVQTTAAAPSSTFDLRGIETEYGDALSVTVAVGDGAAQATATASATISRPKP